MLFGELVDGILWEVALKGKSLSELTGLQRNLLLTRIAHPYTEGKKKSVDCQENDLAKWGTL